MSLHPYVIHLPIVLILLWPIVDACGFGLHRPDVSNVGLALLLASVAAALTGRPGTGKIVCVVSGGNIDSDVLRTILAGETP